MRSGAGEAIAVAGEAIVAAGAAMETEDGAVMAIVEGREEVRKLLSMRFLYDFI